MRAGHAAAAAGLLLAVLGFGCGSSSTSSTSSSPEGPQGPPPDLGTGYPGDELALEPPDPSEGFQLRYGPADYTPEAMADYLLGPGQEAENCFFTTTPNEQEVFLSEYKGRMRPGSHHLILWGLGSEETEGLRACPFDRDRFIFGSQSPEIDITDEHNEGFALRLPPRTPVALDLHYLNTSDQEILREAWVNVRYMDPAAVKQVLEPIMWIDLGINVPPHALHVEHSACEAPADVSLRLLTAHMHARGVRASVWVTTGGEKRLVYETYEWGHPGELRYDDYTQNPAPDPAARTTGGVSGPIHLQAGDLVEWECEFNNTTAEEYHFGDSAMTHEMCNIFGLYYPSMGENWKCFVTD